MADTKLLTAIATQRDRIFRLSSKFVTVLQVVLLLCGLSLLSIVILVLEIIRTQGNPGLAPETPKRHQLPISAPIAQVPSRPQQLPLCRRCLAQVVNGLTLHPQQPAAESSPGPSPSSSGSVDSVAAQASVDTPPLRGSEGQHDTAPEEAAPARTMRGTTAIAHHHHNGPVSPPQMTTPAQQAALTDDEQAKVLLRPRASSSSEDVDSERLRRRNVKMREDGVRVNVKYAQLTAPTWKPRQQQANVTPTAATAAAVPSSSPTSGPLTPSTPGSGISTGVFVSGVQTPAPTPTEPQQQQKQKKVLSSVLPTSGDAAAAEPALVKIHEQLLAVPADAVSRRLLRDGRAILQRRGVRTPRSSSSLSGEQSGPQRRDSDEGGRPGSASGRGSSGYPSELLE